MPQSKKDHLSWAHPLVRDWFIEKFGEATEPQQQGWPAILAGKTTLISAPTGSGKTLSAFLICIDELVRKSIQGTLSNQTEIVYISPLKALSNDIHKNLTEPLHEIVSLAKKRDIPMEDIRVAVRTGDTLARERQAMLKKPPHILVTTPESFYILLTAEKSRNMLSTIHTVIVDEIHAMLNNKRGAHLGLSLERLTAITNKPPLRIGLSATQKPIETVAHFLTGAASTNTAIVNIGHAKQLDLAIEVPNSELGSVASNEMWDEIYDKLAACAAEHRSTLIFVNTRRLAERIAHHLRERLGEDQVAAHHGSLSRKLRLNVETKLKNGELKILVATASLELGIDIGSIDLVCQIGSPRAIAIALQRVGRAGHWHGAISKGRIFVTTRDELLECAALIYAIRQGDLDQLIIPHEPLDILAQQIVAIVATGDWSEDDLFALIKRSYSYKDLSRDTFNSILDMLSEGIAGSRGRYSAYVFRDKVNHIIKGRRGSRLTAITSGGAIPDNGLFSVIAEPDGVMVGTLDEDFAVESNRGDIILLGNTSWRIKRVEGSAGRVLVEDAHGAPPSVPFWRGEAPARTAELSLYVSKLREKISQLLPHSETNAALHWLQQECGTNLAGAEQVVEYILQGRAVLGEVPSQTTIIAERFFDESGGMQLIIHAPFGARINKAWGLALRKRFCRSFNFELQAAATDDGINISLTEQHSFPLSDVFQFVHPNTLKETLVQAVLQSPLFTTRWRWSATRSLALVRFRRGRKVPPNIQRMLSEDLLAAVFPDAAACQDNLGGKDIILPDHPLINETMKDALHEALDLEGLMDVIQAILAGKIRCLAVDTPVPSPFSHEILNANPYAFLDDAPLEERRARAVQMRRMLPESVLQEVGKLDKTAIIEVQQQAWPDVRNADELHDFLQTVIAFPLDFSERDFSMASWAPYLQELVSDSRITTAQVGNKKYWVAAEKLTTFNTIYSHAIFEQALTVIETKSLQREEALLAMIKGWLFHLGPVTNLFLTRLFNLTSNEIEQVLYQLEATGLILRGHFTHDDPQQIEWCERRLLARIHRYTVGILRKEIEPVTTAQYMRWLIKWQHLSKDSHVHGEQGLLAIIKQLQGFEIPANAWEKHIFAKRMIDYHPDLLDRLCLSGTIGWGRLSTHPTTLSKSIRPTSIVPITFFIREECDWLPEKKSENNESGLTELAKEVFAYLKKHGASFFSDIVKSVGRLKLEIENALWELVAAGLITADGFDNLRALIDVRRRLDKRRRLLSLRYSTGRWSILHIPESFDTHKQIEGACWMLLNRYGIVFRDLIAREKNIPSWRELLFAFRRMEDRGEIRGGRFVSGFLGEQFALSYAVDSLRLIKKELQTDEVLSLSGVDPLNLIGIILPGDKVSAHTKKTLLLKNGCQWLEALKS